MRFKSQFETGYYFMEKEKSIKEKIINSAKNLLKSKGSFTIKELAESCYINIAAVNYHFGSKEHLLNIVLQEIVDELKVIITESVDNVPEGTSVEDTIGILLNLFYMFSSENIGIINYLFLNKEYQNKNSHILIREFFIDSPFTRSIYEKIATSTQIQDHETLRVKYLLLFSSFALPMFIQILSNENQDETLSLESPSFRKKYIKELLKILHND